MLERKRQQLKRELELEEEKEQFGKHTTAKGLNFVPSKKIDIPKTLAAIENSIKQLPDNNKAKIRTEVTPIIKNLERKNKTNLNQGERQAIRSLKQNKDIVITPSDKGRNTVIMNTTDYNTKVEELLQDKEIYEPLTKNPSPNFTKDFNKKLNKIIRSHKLDKKTFENLKAEDKNLPNFYGLPKVHKPNTPLRPIVSYAGSPLYPLTKFISSIISPLQKLLPHTVPNSTVAAKTIRNLSISNNSRMVSFDVESLYTSIPHNEAILALQKFTETHQNLDFPFSTDALIDLIKLCLEHNYFSHQNKFYRQIKGLPMGNPISSALANIFMDQIDQVVTESKQLKIIFWKRYIDDIFCITESDFVVISNFLNNLRPFLKFTHEIENNNSLAFLDLQLKRKFNQIETSIFRKSTHTGNYLNFNSFGPVHHKIAVVKSLSKRLDTHCSSKINDIVERNRIFSELKNNNYPSKFIEKHFYKPKSPLLNNTPVQSKKLFCSLPYSYGSERIARVLKRYNITTTYQSSLNLKKALRHPDTKQINKMENKINVIYKIPCNKFKLII
ncbi:hypothetical protein LAZ67_20002153 [Cordylochernes scorpioides]|uniref:Reverse transcriptase domain-containing protein n=1 Tax=Cordylochernes scorpioides TaxID=51811 RepID=A0ABY6LPF4_9ARAC|nr:hypothetical protein LAZ67_20002153 [Cordylochernes scorpioides]